MTGRIESAPGGSIVSDSTRAQSTLAEWGLSPQDLATLSRAVGVLERPSLAIRLAGMAGRPLELLGQALPQAATSMISHATEAALKNALRVALTSLPKEPAGSTGPRFHKALAATSGAIGGAFGLATLALELPVSTTLMLRAIAATAQREGEDLEDPKTALACLQVFALGGRNESDDAAESGYFAVRAALAKSIAEAARMAADKGFVKESAPALVRLVAQIASRFGLVVSQKVAAQAVPIVGALGGAAVNAAFMDHFQGIAGAHFAIRRLERSYGREPIQAAYERIRRGEA